MNFELSKGTVITLIVVAVVVIGGLLWHFTRPTTVPFPPDYDPSGGLLPRAGRPAPAGGAAPAQPVPN